MSRLVVRESKGDIATLVLNRPSVLNAINGAMRDALIKAFQELNQDRSVKAIVLMGSGDRAFSAGQDLAEAAAFSPEEVKAWMTHQCRLLQAMRDLEKPAVAAFNGVAAGVGFQLGLLADLRVGYPDMRLGQPEVKVGLASIMGSSLMSLHLGHALNNELSLLGKLITGQRAHDIGLLNRLVVKEEVVPVAWKLAEEFAALPSEAVRLTKQRFRAQSQSAFDAACQDLIRYQYERYLTGEPQDIMQRFLTKSA
ncbi:MAG: enoyl-CoA hydratase/isomerase family protein [Rhodobacteraceae bacterium]|nr:enoyl-CoA hydratase/isomerase family protein [Paracoccaceae bacterium]